MTGQRKGFKESIEKNSGGLSLSVLLGALIGSVVFTIIVIVSVFIIWKRRNRSSSSQVVHLGKNGQGNLHDSHFCYYKHSFYSFIYLFVYLFTIMLLQSNDQPQPVS